MIRMQYPRISGNSLCDGTVHEIVPYHVYRVEGSELYVMEYYDQTRRCQATTVLIRGDNGRLTKVPLVDYQSLFDMHARNEIRLIPVDDMRMFLNYMEEGSIIATRDPVASMQECLEVAREATRERQRREEAQRVTPPSTPPITPPSNNPPRYGYTITEMEPQTQTEPRRDKIPPYYAQARAAIILYIDNDSNIYYAEHGIRYKVDDSSLIEIMEKYDIEWRRKETNRLATHAEIDNAIYNTIPYISKFDINVEGLYYHEKCNDGKTYHYTLGYRYTDKNGHSRII